MQKAKLVLEDGTEVWAHLGGAAVSVSGELVFNTAMTGYPESLTDPSYKGQILVATYPIIGNYGVPDNRLENNIHTNFESNKIHLSGLIISDYSEEFSHWNALKNLSAWMAENNIPLLYGVDTRFLTKIIRNNGSVLAKIISNNDDVDLINPAERNLVSEVSQPQKEIYGSGNHKIMLIDCGLKNNIIRNLLVRDTTVIRVPWNHDISQEEYDGLFISNGPGDPKKCDITINSLRIALQEEKPIFGICLGSQLMALASGADTYKMPFGHRGHNQPVQYLPSGKAFITSQNHGYAVDETTLNSDWEILFRNLNDQSVEGIIHKSKPFFSTQFHPEAAGGPTDTEFLFDEFITKIEQFKNSNVANHDKN